MKKQKNHKELEGEKLRGKRRFIERVAEEKEAEQQIKEFDRNEDIIIGETYLDDTKRRTTNR